MNDLSAWVERLVEAVEEVLGSRMRRPEATYRLQFHRDQLTFREAARAVPYLRALGISHAYASPCRKARSGSSHGYALVDYNALNPELGTNEDYRALVDTLHAHGMGKILDIVPNHMSATAGENAWWNNVLENGRSSPYAAYFDINWEPIKDELENRLLLPLLGDQYGESLESGKLQLEYRDGGFFARYFQAALPLDPRTFPTILTCGVERLKQALGADSEDVRELESIITAAEHLPDRNDTQAQQVVERQREKEVLKHRLHKLVTACPAVANSIQQTLRQFNGDPAAPESFDRLDKLLDAQVYRLSHWKAAGDEINYRRFFDVNELAAICTEDSRVFEESHRMALDLAAQGVLDGLRIDHIDGLFDPTEYLVRLQRGYLRALGRAAYQRLTEANRSPTGNSSPAESAYDVPDWSELEPQYLQAMESRRKSDWPLYVVVEKILGPEEPLPREWPIAGTTGYDFLNLVSGLFVDRAGLEELVKIYSRFIDERVNFREVAYQAKQLILHVSMASDLQLLAHRLNRISERHRRSRDFTLNELRIALREVLACFPVYRTYIRAGQVAEHDRQFVGRAVALAKRRNPARNAAVFDFIRDVLLLEAPPNLDEAGRQERDLFVGRFQQVTSPVIAKGIEDTAFYRYFPLASLNEVGGEPARGTTTPEEFHHQNLARFSDWPYSLIATSTHDTKRSEDVRARIHVLSEIPRAWRTVVNRWARFNRRRHREVDGQPAPSRNDEYLFYQTLVGIWPLYPVDREGHRRLVDRLQAYMEKATHEAKLFTSWINPNVEYDRAVRQFVAAVMEDYPKNRFLADFRLFHERIVLWGLYTALSQALLKFTSPGVPDVYQGQELWDFSLVDPDNRRRTDYGRRQEMLSALEKELAAGDEARLALARQLAADPRDDRTKLFVTWQSLQVRRQYPHLFQRGRYVPLAVEGEHAPHVCAFAWVSAAAPAPSEGLVMVVVPRLLARLTPWSEATGRPPAPLGEAVWGNTRIAVGGLPACRLRNAFTGQVCSLQDSHLALSTILTDFPVALLSYAP